MHFIKKEINSKQINNLIMKTMVIFRRNYLLVLMLMTAAMQAMGAQALRATMQPDSAVRTYAGKVINEVTKEPVVFANVYIIGSSVGTVTNAEGEFVIKVPAADLGRKLGFSYLGYQSLEVSLAELKADNNVIRMSPAAVQIEEVVIRNQDPYNLVNLAINSIPRNFPVIPERLIGFYRETVKENRNYVMVAEAVLDVYKSSYRNDFDFDRVAIFKGRKSDQLKKMDTINFKVAGGPRTSIMLDLVKDPGGILSVDYIDYYNFWFDGFAMIDGRNNYVIGFDQKDNVDLSLYKGKIYIDTKSMAFTRFEFSLSDKEIASAANELVRKKPMDLKVDVLNGNYVVNYRVVNDQWYLNHVRSELTFKTEWKKKRFNATYVTTLEMAVTDRDSVNIEKAKYKQQARTTDILADNVKDYEDENFWGDYNYIKPDESIESVINRLNRRLRWEVLDEAE